MNPLHPIYTSKDARRQFDTEHAAWLKPVREAFHDYMIEHEGYGHLDTPAPGVTYAGAHPQMLWECWLAATLVASPLAIDHSP